MNVWTPGLLIAHRPSVWKTMATDSGVGAMGGMVLLAVLLVTALSVTTAPQDHSLRPLKNLTLTHVSEVEMIQPSLVSI